jgi:hypothetical protein
MNNLEFQFYFLYLTERRLQSNRDLTNLYINNNSNNITDQFISSIAHILEINKLFSCLYLTDNQLAE